MSYKNFVPEVWAEGIERELDRVCVFAEDCNRKYEGKVKNQGDSVKILGVGRPTITTITKAAKDNIDVGEPEIVPTTSEIMYINQISWFNYGIDDIDKAQGIDGIMDALESETSEALANEVDKHISSMAVDSSVPKLYGAAPIIPVSDENAGEGKAYVLDILDEAILHLRENDVADSTPIVVTMSYKFFNIFKKAYTKLDTNNSDMLKNGKVGMYGKVTVKCSNNVHKTNNGTVDNIMMRTKRAIAYAQPLTHTEAYRPEKGFKDAIKGFILYQAKVVRPKEVININVKYA